MSSAIQTCFDSWPEIPIEIGAQTYLQEFYEGLGFIAISSPYDEDGIMHVDMRLTFFAWLKA
jgi:ElaA protein